MRLQFGYAWKELHFLLYAVPIAFAFGAYRNGGFTWSSTIVMSGVFGVMAIWRAWPISRVLISESSVDVRFLIPFRRNVSYPHDAIERYAEMAPSLLGKKLLVGGALVPKSDDPVTIFATGIKNFDELNSTLSRLFPNTQIAEQISEDIAQKKK